MRGEGMDAGESEQVSYPTTQSQLAVAHSVLLALHHFLGKPFSFGMEECKKKLTGRGEKREGEALETM